MHMIELPQGLDVPLKTFVTLYWLKENIDPTCMFLKVKIPILGK